MVEGTKITLSSKRTNKNYDAIFYQTENGDALVIRHTSLEHIFWHDLTDDERPECVFDIPDINKLCGIPPMFAMSCTLSWKGGKIQQIGEYMAGDWAATNDCIKRSFPLTICKNRAFDRAVLRYMMFDISDYDVATLYSTEEVDNVVGLTGGKITVPNSANAGNTSAQASAPDIPDINGNQQGAQAQTPPVPYQVPQQNAAQQNKPQNDEPQQQAPSKRIIPQVFRVTYNPQEDVSMIETDVGMVWFRLSDQAWRMQDQNLFNSIDFNALYNAASAVVNCDLIGYRPGANGPFAKQ